MTVAEAILTIVLFVGTSIFAAITIIAAPLVRDARSQLRNRRRA